MMHIIIIIKLPVTCDVTPGQKRGDETRTRTRKLYFTRIYKVQPKLMEWGWGSFWEGGGGGGVQRLNQKLSVLQVHKDRLTFTANLVRLRTFGRQYVTPNVSANRLVELAHIARPGFAPTLAHATLLARRAKPPRPFGVTLCIAVKTVSAFANTRCQTERKKGAELTKELCESRRGRPWGSRP